MFGQNKCECARGGLDGKAVGRTSVFSQHLLKVNGHPNNELSEPFKVIDGTKLNSQNCSQVLEEDHIIH